MLKLKPISWRANPAQMKDDIDFNFKTIESYFSEIIQNKLTSLEVESANMSRLKIKGEDIESIFVKPDFFNLNLKEGDDIVKIKKNSKQEFEIRLSSKPNFQSLEVGNLSSKKIYLNGHDINDIFITKNESDSLAKYTFNPNFFYIENNNISLKPQNKANYLHISSNTMDVNSIEVGSANILELKLRGNSIDQLLGSHTFISTNSENLYTSGTKNNPVIHLKDTPHFSSITGDSIMSDSIVSKAINSNDISTKALYAERLSFLGFQEISDRGFLFDGFSFNKDLQTTTIGIGQEKEISSFKRTSLRIVPKKDDIIHHSILVQTRGSKKDRDISNKNTQFVVKGNGHIGIGKYDTTSKLDIFSKEGFDQLRLSTSYTPQTTLEKSGSEGNIAWDDEFIYVKTKKGWKRSQLFSF